MVAFTLHSARFEYIFNAQKEITQSLQQKMEEAWVGVEKGCTSRSLGRGKGSTLPFPREEAKYAIRQLRKRLKEYLLAVQMELINTKGGKADGVGVGSGSSRARTRPERSISTSRGTPIPSNRVNNVDIGEGTRSQPATAMAGFVNANIDTSDRNRSEGVTIDALTDNVVFGAAFGNSTHFSIFE